MKWILLALAVLFVTAMPSLGAALAIGNGTYSNKIKAFAQAIGKAEGFGIQGARPTINNNPGDLEEIGDAGRDSNGYAVYSSAAAGWDALYRQLNLIILGTSNYYNLDMTISDMAYQWTSTQQDAWSDNVASSLGVTRDTVIRGLLT